MSLFMTKVSKAQFRDVVAAPVGSSQLALIGGNAAAVHATSIGTVG
jgi:hypothetical protein